MKKITISAVIGVAAIAGMIGGFIGYEPSSPVNQADLKSMVEQRMSNPALQTIENAIEIMEAYYLFAETANELSDDQEGLFLQNQIENVIAKEIPQSLLTQLKSKAREQATEMAKL